MNSDDPEKDDPKETSTEGIVYPKSIFAWHEFSLAYPGANPARDEENEAKHNTEILNS